MPQCFQDCVSVPIPKGNKDASLSLITGQSLASFLSKVIGGLLVGKYADSLSPLQFGLNLLSCVLA